MPQLSLRRYGTGIACHAHNYNQIVLPRHGRLAMDIAGQGGSVSQRHGAFIQAGIDHAYQAGAEDEFFVLDLIDAEGQADEINSDELVQAPFFDLTPAQHALLSYLDHRSNQSAADVAQLGESWGFLILDSLARLHRQSGTVVMPIALTRALDFMQERYADKLSISEIARSAGLSETRFFLLCRQHLRMTPHAYLNDLRLAAAERLLSQSRHAIGEIALLAGYGDQSALTKQMQRRRGTTPAAYRRQFRR